MSYAAPITETAQAHRNRPSAFVVGPDPREQQIHWAVLSQGEKETFRAGLAARITGRIDKALREPNAASYRTTAREQLAAYTHLVGVLALECGIPDPSVADVVLTALDQVEENIGESYRHRLEHAINISDSSRRIVANIQGPCQDDDAHAQLANVVHYAAGWLSLSWSVDAILWAATASFTPDPTVLDALFEDLTASAQDIYVSATAMYDLIMGDPDDDNDND